MNYGCLGDWWSLASGKVKMLAKYFVSMNLWHSWPPTPLHSKRLTASVQWNLANSCKSILPFNMHRILFSLFTDCKLSWKANEASRACYTPDTYISTATVGKYANISFYMLNPSTGRNMMRKYDAWTKALSRLKEGMMSCAVHIVLRAVYQTMVWND